MLERIDKSTMKRFWWGKPHPTVLVVLALLCAVMVPAEGANRNSKIENRKSIEPLNRFPRMVQEYFVQSVRRIERRANQRREALKTAAGAEAYVHDIQEKIQQSFGPWPERTPLKPRITGVVERDAYKIEKIIFESRPGFLVTANLYIPQRERLTAARRRRNVRPLGNR